MILDFEDNLKYVYPLIYERMARSRSLQADSSSSISDGDLIIKSDKPSIVLSIEVGSPTIMPGNQQKLVINVLDEKSNKKVVGAKVSGEIVYPSGSHVLLEEYTSDSDGRISYLRKINHNSELGLYSVKLHSSASGYKPSSTTTTFEVTNSSNTIR